MRSIYEQPALELFLLEAESIADLPEQSGGVTSNPFPNG